MEGKRLLEIKDLHTVFHTDDGAVRAVDGVDLWVDEGEVLGLVGESGCGKSVTAHSVMRLVSPPGRIESGEILFRGRNLLKVSQREMHQVRGSRIAMIYQEPMSSLNPLLRVGTQIVETVTMHMHKTKREALGLAVDMLRAVGIPDPEHRVHDYPHQLSGGMRQRVMIAIALACEPKLLIADEPTTALDVTIQAQILELMQDLRKKLGMSIIMITHDLGVVASMCEKIAVMYAGHIVEYGTTDEIFYQPGHEYTKGLINSIPKLNTAEHERLVPIEGTPVDLLNPPAGCPFAPRCKNCMKICLSKMPPRTELSDTHYTYCWLQQKAAFEKGEKAE